MAKTLARPIPLKAGRWSINPRSKGNFVYSFDGYVPFDIITLYEHILLEPFQGSGKLCPSLGWTRLMAHGVPVWDNNGSSFGPGALLEETRALPGLRKAFFAMQPRWLKPLERIESQYSTITFTISDPDGSITNTLLNNRAAFFGKEVTISRWVDKPALIQCSRCHALGHNRASRLCPLGKDSVKCYRCGGAHRTEKHDQQCPRKHAVAGLCNCTHFKCINCHKMGHNSKDIRCPARELYRPRATRKADKARNKGKEKAMDLSVEQMEEGNTPLESIFQYPTPNPPSALNEDPFNPPLTPTERELQPMEWDYTLFERAGSDWDSDAPIDPLAGWTREFQPPEPRTYSPSHPQSGANPATVA